QMTQTTQICVIRGLSALDTASDWDEAGRMKHSRVTRRRIGRREFVSLGLMAGAATFVRARPRSSGAGASFLEKSIPELQSLMIGGALTSAELTALYLDRIADLNPLLHAVIETNPDAASIAAGLDAERAAGNLRGLLHGIPVLLKDNIATA